MRPTRARHVVANSLAGLVLGIGVSLMLALYGTVGWSSTTPDLIIVVGVVVGVGVGLLPVRTVRGTSTPGGTSEPLTAAHRSRRD